MTLYTDVTGNPDAEGRADQLPELREALLTLGFKRVGFLEARSSDSPARQAQMTLMFEKDNDAELVRRVLTEGQVTEITASQDETAFAELERFFDDQLIELRTILEDGAIIETTTKPMGRPQRRDPIKGLRDIFESALLQRFMNWVRGDRVFLWATEHHPRAGYYLELVDNSSAERLWHRHRQRVAAIAESRGTSIPSQNSMRLYLAICERISELNRYRKKVQNIGELVTVLLIILLVVVFLLFFVAGTFDRLLETDSTLAGVVLFATIAAFFLVPLAGLAWPRRIGPWVGRQLPWPGPRSLEDLLR